MKSRSRFEGNGFAAAAGYVLWLAKIVICPDFNNFHKSRFNGLSAIKTAMFRVLGVLFGLLHRSFHSRRDLLLENLALRQQLVAFQRRNPKPRLREIDRRFWVMARRLWSRWKQASMYVTPETVARWHHAGFRLYWGWLSRHDHALGRKRISKQVRDLIFQMVAENHTWGAPHIHGELLKLGSIFRNAPCPAGCNERRRIQNWHDAGKHSFTIIGKRLQQWISSQCPQSLSVSSTASS